MIQALLLRYKIIISGQSPLLA